MKAGDIVYDSDAIPESRGELEEFLCDCITEVLGSSFETDRMSNGYIADTLFNILDILVITTEQKEKLKTFLKEYSGEESWESIDPAKQCHEYLR